jgi:outer membrane autotransporter protein
MKLNTRTFLRHLCVSASTLSILANLPAQAGVSIPRISQNATSNISTATDWNPNGFATGDSMVYGGNHTILADLLGNFDINVVSSANNPVVGNVVITNSTVNFGSISSGAGGGGVNIVLGFGGKATLTSMAGDMVNLGIGPNNYSKFSSFDFGNIANSTLTITNNTPITLNTNFKSTGGNAGSIVLNNNSNVTFNGTFSSAPNTVVSSISVFPASVATINNNLYLSSMIDLNTGGKVVFGPNVSVNVPVIAHKQFNNIYGFVDFQGNNDINAQVGTGYYVLDTVNINGALRFNENSLSATTVNFRGTNPSIILNGSPTSPDNFITFMATFTTENDGQGDWTIAKDSVLGYAQFGTSNARFNNINLINDSALNLMADTPYVQSITTNHDGQGVFVLFSTNPMSLICDVGTPSAKLKILSPQYAFVEGSYISAELTLKSGISVYADELPLYYSVLYKGANGTFGTPVLADSSKLIIEDNVLLDAPVTTLNGIANGSTGIIFAEVDIQASATILRDIGTSSDKMDYIKFNGAAGSNVNLHGNLHGTNIISGAGTISLGNDLTFDGLVTATSTAYGLSNHTLTFNNSVRSYIPGASSVSFTVNDSSYGHFFVTNGLLDMNYSSTHMNLSLTDTAVILPPAGPTGQSYVIFGDVGPGGDITVIDNSKVSFIIVQQNPFVTWSYNNGIATRVRLPQDQINQLLGLTVTSNGGSNTAAQNAIKIANQNNTGSAAGLFQSITSLIVNNSRNLVEALNDLQPVIIEASEQISEVVEQSGQIIWARLQSLATPNFFVAQGDDSEDSGVAAGDEVYKHGVWTSAFLGQVNQKTRGESPGFISRTHGGMIGGDTMITDQATVGLAVSYAINRVDHKGGNQGEKTKVNAYTISAYAAYDFSEKWFAEGMGLFTRNKIDNKEIRRATGVPEIARGNYHVNAYGLNGKVGYNHLLTNKLLMTNTVGAEFLVLAKSSYQETGTTHQNLLIKKKEDTKLNLHVGSSLSHDAELKGYKYVPEVHASISYDVLNKRPKVEATLAGLYENRLLLKTAEASKVFYNLGTQVSMNKGAAEASLSYDLFLGNRYVGQQGAIKLRLNF